MKRNSIKFLGILLFVSSSLFANQVIEMNQKQERDLGVKTQPVTKIETIMYGPYNGKVVLDNKDIISISSNLESVVTNIYVRKFQEVKKGQKLLTLRSNELLNLQKEYIQALIETQNLSETYERDLKLNAEGIISEKKLTLSKKEFQSVQLQEKLSKNHLLASGLTASMLRLIEKKHIPYTQLDFVAPKDGTIYEVNVNVGEVVHPDKSMMILYADGERFVELAVPVKMVENINIGDRCEFDTYSAKVTSIGRVIDNASQSVEVRALIENAKDIIINRVYELSIFKPIDNSVKIKKSALVYEGNNAFVFKKVSSGYEVVEVEVISEGPSCYVVAGDLDADDKVAVTSTSALLGGMEDE